MTSHFILYVSDQNRSTEFYSKALGLTPRLDVPGMTEFELGDKAVLGLMPVEGIKRLLGPALPDPEMSASAPRSEVYLIVEHADTRHEAALSAGAKELSPVEERDWGHRAGYCLDPDNHVLAFAEEK